MDDRYSDPWGGRFEGIRSAVESIPSIPDALRRTHESLVDAKGWALVVALIALVITWKLHSHIYRSYQRLHQFHGDPRLGSTTPTSLLRRARRHELSWGWCAVFGAAASVVQILFIGPAAEAVHISVVYYGGLVWCALGLGVIAYTLVFGKRDRKIMLRCRRCGYPRNEDERCTECGREIGRTGVMMPGWRTPTKRLPGARVCGAFAFGLCVLSVGMRVVPLPVHVWGIASARTEPIVPQNQVSLPRTPTLPRQGMVDIQNLRWRTTVLTTNGHAQGQGFERGRVMGTIHLYQFQGGVLPRISLIARAVVRRSGTGADLELVAFYETTWRAVDRSVLEETTKDQTYFHAPADEIDRINEQRIEGLLFLLGQGDRPVWIHPAEVTQEFESRPALAGVVGMVLMGVMGTAGYLWWSRSSDLREPVQEQGGEAH